MEKKSWEYEANQTEKKIEYKSLLEGFNETIKKDPSRVAVIDSEGRNYSYGELGEQVASLAGKLIKMGVKKGDRVAISLPRSKDMITAVLAVLWAGGAYVPVNCSQPEERRRRIYEKSEINYCITYYGTTSDLIEECTNIYIESLDEAAEKVIPKAYIAEENETAYIIFTSGSTGEPKGVEISHGGAWNTIADVLDRFQIDNRDTALCVSALDFDLSVFDIFGLLSCGGRIVLLDDSTYKEPASWKKAVNNYQVTVWNSVPALFEMMLVSLSEGEKLNSLKKVLLSGDWVRPDLYLLIKQHTSDCRFFALGGATEASIWSNYYEVKEIDSTWNSVPYGKPLANQMFRVIVDGMDNTQGEVGELWIGGKGLAKGYVGDPKLTEDAFIYEEGQRWYRTGDYGYYMPDGNIIFAGRKDNQVKINGFRIELGEIESKLSDIQGINKALAVVKKNGDKNSLAAALEIENICKCENEIEDLKCDIASPKDPHNITATYFIKEMLEEIVAHPELEDEFDEGSQKIVTLWDQYIKQVSTNPINSEQCDLEFKKILDSKKSLILSILRGETSRFMLLDDEDIAPTKLMESEGLKSLIEIIGQSLIKQIEEGKKQGRVTRISIVMGRQGRIYEKILSKLAGYKEDVEFYYFESSDGLMAEAADIFEKSSLKVEMVKTGYEYVNENYFHVMDAVLVINGIHLFEDIYKGISWINLLLRKGGSIYAAESTQLTALGLISAAILEDGFLSYTDGRGRVGIPMLTGNLWKKVFESNSYELLREEEYKDSFVSYFHLVFNQDQLTSQQIKDIEKDKLLPYMVPEDMVYTHNIPLNTNGKLDRKTVNSWFQEKIEKTGTEPGTDTEEKLAKIWMEILKVKKVFIEDSFFEIGGDSLLAARMINGVKTVFAVNLTMREVFDASSLEKISSLIDGYLNCSDMEEGEL